MKQDANLRAVQQHLKLCHKLLQVRLAKVAAQPPGEILRNNQVMHTQALLGLLSVLRGMAAHDTVDWWDDHDGVPF